MSPPSACVDGTWPPINRIKDSMRLCITPNRTEGMEVKLRVISVIATGQFHAPSALSTAKKLPVRSAPSLADLARNGDIKVTCVSRK